jgi:L-amino acid N-acyltransferase YncA
MGILGRELITHVDSGMEIKARIATEDDVDPIVDIYNQAVALGTATADISPVTTESRRLWLREHSPDHYPVFVAEHQDEIIGWCSLSPYRPGRMALRHTAEISYYIDENSRGMGVGSFLISHAIEKGSHLGIKTLFAIILDVNEKSTQILEKFGFEQWGHMPNIAEFDGRECGHLYYGLRVAP